MPKGIAAPSAATQSATKNVQAKLTTDREMVVITKQSELMAL